MAAFSASQQPPSARPDGHLYPAQPAVTDHPPVPVHRSDDDTGGPTDRWRRTGRAVTNPRRRLSPPADGASAADTGHQQRGPRRGGIHPGGGSFIRFVHFNYIARARDKCTSSKHLNLQYLFTFILLRQSFLTQFQPTVNRDPFIYRFN